MCGVKKKIFFKKGNKKMRENLFVKKKTYIFVVK